jgi:hypothetical protein
MWDEAWNIIFFQEKSFNRFKGLLAKIIIITLIKHDKSWASKTNKSRFIIGVRAIPWIVAIPIPRKFALMTLSLRLLILHLLA